MIRNGTVRENQLNKDVFLTRETSFFSLFKIHIMFLRIIKLNHVNAHHVYADKVTHVRNIIIHEIVDEIRRYLNTSKTFDFFWKKKQKLLDWIESIRSTPCPHVKQSDEWIDPTVCESGDNCKYCHTRTEQQFHPEVTKIVDWEFWNIEVGF